MQYLKSSVAGSALIAKTNEYATMKVAVPGQASPADLNAQASALIRTRAIKMCQNIFTTTVNPANTPVINVTPQAVGLVIGWIVEVNATLLDPGAGNSLALTPFGPANAFSQITYNDISNVNRIQTTGWHLHCVNTNKGGIPYAAARTNTNYPLAFGDTFGGNLAANQANNIIQAASVYDHTHFAQGVQMMYWVPTAYSMDDLRGSYYGNVINANAQLQFTINPNATAFVAATADPIGAVYQGSAGVITSAGWGTQFTVNVYQVYYDQLPVDPKSGQPILPYLSMSILYQLQNSTFPAITANQDFPIPYANFRDFLSTTVIYDNPNNGVFGAPGADVNYWALRQANSTNIFKIPPKYTGLYARAAIGDDYPPQCYFFNSREKPISTVSFGNMQLILNAAVANGTPQALVGFEYFSYQNTIAAASSLSSGT